MCTPGVELGFKSGPTSLICDPCPTISFGPDCSDGSREENLGSLPFVETRVYEIDVVTEISKGREGLCRVGQAQEDGLRRFKDKG